MIKNDEMDSSDCSRTAYHCHLAHTFFPIQKSVLMTPMSMETLPETFITAACSASMTVPSILQIP